MEIVKKLNLNKTPQAVDNGSLIFAKNIKLSADSHYLTNEESLLGVASLANKIVGVIPTNKELVVFKYDDVNNISSILRIKETESGVETVIVPNNWKYNGGTITGTYTYNVKNELIVAFGEYDANIDVPLKTINLDTSTANDYEDLYNIAPNVPICNCKLNRLVSGVAMPNGVYHLFIRYEITNDVYTKWFPIGVPYYAINLQTQTIIKHRYADGSTISNCNIEEDFNDDDADVPYNFELNLSFNNSTHFINYQIGYVLQHENAQVGRLWKKFNLNGKTHDTIVFNTDGAQEFSIDDLVEDTYNLYNVQNLTNYNNRLYIGNYEESKTNVDLRAIVNNIKVKYTREEVTDVSSTTVVFQGTKNGTTKVKSFATEYTRIGKRTITFMTWFNDFAYYFTTSGTTKSDANYLLSTTGQYVRFSDIKTMCSPSDNTYYLTYYSSYSINNDFNSTGSIYQYNGGSYIAVDTYNFAPISIQSFNVDNSLKLVGQYTPFINKRSLIPNQVYNFFVHFVRADGSHTNGIQIPNNVSPLTYTITGDTTITPNVTSLFSSVLLPTNCPTWLTTLYQQSTVKTLRLCDVINNFDETNEYFGYYENNNGDKLFKAPDFGNSKDKIGVSFTDVTIPAGYVGCFFSYEKVEANVQYECYTTRTSNYFAASDVQLALNNYSGLFFKEMYKQNYTASGTPTSRTYTTAQSSQRIFLVNTAKPLSPDTLTNNAYNTQNQGASIYLSLLGATDLSTGQVTEDIAFSTTIGQVFVANPYLYTNKNKELVKLGGVLYKPENVEINNAEYSELTVSSDFNYPGFICEDRVLVYDKRGVLIGDDGTAKKTDNSTWASVDDFDDYANLAKFYKYSNYQLLAISLKKKPEVLITTVNNNRAYNLVVYPANSGDLIQLQSHYIESYIKSFVNYNTNLIENNKFSKTIRRSDVIATESAENAWRYFKPDAYKVISENKGSITNITGIGLYLLVHTEHSLFMFNRDASMKTADKDIQLSIPDAFDTEYQEVFTSDKGYGGLQDKNAWTINEHGYFFYDNDAKKLYNFDNGQLNIVSTDISEFIEAYKIEKVRLVGDGNNNRIIICFQIEDNKYVTISFSTALKSYVSLHDYYFNYGWNTKNNCYLFGNNDDNKRLYTFKNSTTIGKYEGLQLKDNSIFPAYYNEDGDICYSVIDVITNVSYETTKALESLSYILSEQLEYAAIINQAESELNRRYSGYRLRLYSDCCKSNMLDINVDNLPNQHNNYKYPWYDKGCWNLNYFRNYIERKESDNQSLIYGKYIVASFIFNNDAQKRIKLENVTFNLSKY